MIIITEVSYGGENKLQYDSDFIYTSMINIQTYSEWSEYYRLLPVSDVIVNNTSTKKTESNKSNNTWYNIQTPQLKLRSDYVENSANYHIYDRSKKYYDQIINIEN